MAKQMLYKYLWGIFYWRNGNSLVLKDYARQTKNHLKKTEVDVLFCPSTLPIAYLEWPKPMVFWTDMTFHQALEYDYPGRLTEKTIEAGHRLERNVLARCSLALYSSDWAARSALDYYQAPPHKVKVVPFGANLDIEHDWQDIEEAIARRSRAVCHLLFIGVDWERKGGPRVLKVAEELNRRGVKTVLEVVGCQPPEKALPDFVKVHGFVSKRTLAGRQKLNDLFKQAHFLIMLSAAEAYGLVLCEANAFGVPCIASRVGGMTTIIRDGVNGRLFSEDDEVADICEAIATKFLDPDSYGELAKASFHEYSVRLNWRAAGEKVTELLESII